MRRLAIVAVTASVCLAACAVPGQGHTARTLHIGVDLPLSGAQAAAGRPAFNGILFYVQQHPRLDGFDVSVVSMDDAGGGAPSPNLGAGNVLKFLADPNLVAMIGPLNASVARKEIPIANAAALAMVSPATSSQCLTRDVFLPARLNPSRTAIACEAAGLPPASSLRPSHVVNYFRLTTTDDLQGPAAADYAVKTLHMFRVAVISDRESYGQGLAMSFGARLQSLGGTVVGRLELEPGKPDAAAFLKQAKDAGAQAIYFGGVTQDQGCVIRAQMKSVFPAGQATPFLSGDGIADDPQCVRDADSNSAGILATVPIVDAGSRPAAAAVISAFKSSFGSTSDYGPFTVPSYDATAVLYSALDRAIRASGGQLPVRGNVVSQLSATTSFAGVTGTFGFDSNGDTTNRVISLLEPQASDSRAPWKLVSAVDYSSTLPY